MLIQKGANINTNVTRAPPELDKEEEEKQKEKKKYWLWRPVRPSPPSPTVKSLLREIIDHEWQGVTFLAMDRLDRFQMSYANAVQVCWSHISLSCPVVSWNVAIGLDLLQPKSQQWVSIDYNCFKVASIEFFGLYKLVKKSSLPLVKVMIFQKLCDIVQIVVHQEKQTHLLLILIPNL